MSSADIFVLYRFYAADDSLLYVGLTINPGRRMEKHRDTKPWWTDVARITMEHHSSIAALRDAEKQAIQTEKPVHNICMNGCNVAPRPPVDAIQVEGLVGRWFHSWRPIAEGEDTSYLTRRGSRVLEWQGQVVDREPPNLYVVQTYSWWDGTSYTQQLVSSDEMRPWTFYDSAIEMQIGLGCTDSYDGPPCGQPVSHFHDLRHAGLGISFYCHGCVKRFPGFRDYPELKWVDGKPAIQ